MYLQGRLYHNLISGKQYCLTFYVVNTKYSGLGCNRISAYLDDGSIDTTTECGFVHTEYVPQITTDSVITDTTNWTMIQGSFTATGSEKFITIGRFTDSTHTSINSFNDSGNAVEAFYLIDDVSVIAIDDSANAGPDRATFPGWDSVWMGDTLGDYLPCYWFSNSGGSWSLLDSNKAGFKVHPDSTTSYVMQLDVCGNITTDTATVWVWPLGVAQPGHLMKEQFVQLFPNPASTHVTIAGASGCYATIYNMIGSKVNTYHVQENKQTIDISELNTGTYSIEITDPQTGMKIVKRLVKE
jgi:hypothetical protein